MNTEFRLKICLLVMLGVLSMVSVTRTQPKANKMLDQRIPEFQVTDAPTSLVLQRLARSSSIPIGIEAAPENAWQTETIAVNMKGATVRNILDFVVEKDPQYVWQPAGSAINVLPKSARDPILETIVRRFEVRNVNKEEAIRALENSIELKRVLMRTALRNRTLKSLPGDSECNLPRFSLHLTNSNVRDILNALMLQSASKDWVFFRHGSKKEFFSLLMR